MTNFSKEKKPYSNGNGGFGRRVSEPESAKPAASNHNQAKQPELPQDALNAIPQTIPATPPSNTNKMTVVAPQTADTHTPLSPYLEQSFQKIWRILKKNADFRQFASMSKEALFTDLSMTVAEMARMEDLKLSPAEMELVTYKLMDEMIGLGPIEPLLQREEVTEIMVNGPKTVYLELNGVIERSAITFRDGDHLVSICQRIANQIGRRVDELSPICDARLADGSRVNIILPPLALDGAVLTIRKFQKERLTLEKLVSFGSVDEPSAELLRIIAACRVNILISGGTGSGKTTLLNCLTRYIAAKERVVTCEDAAELQLQQPHVVRLETRPQSLEGVGEVTMRDLVRNCLRMRPDRIVVGEVRGSEAFDLLQAMNTGHDGSMGTVHANTPRDALGRLESMIAMARLNIPAETVRRQIASSVNVIVQIQRLNDGSRKVISITEISGMEGDTISLQDLMTFELTGKDDQGRLKGRFKLSGINPRFADKLRQYGQEERFLKILSTTIQ